MPEIRRWALNTQSPRPDGEFVLYWMIAARRPVYNWGLQRAAEWARELHKPLVILEALRLDYPWASPRFNHWVQQGMARNARHFRVRPVCYYPFVGDGKGLLASLAARACAVVTDYYPCFFLPRMVEAAARSLPVLLEAVDSNGLVPLQAAPKAYERAVDFRRFVQKWVATHGLALPLKDPIPLDLPKISQLPEMMRWRPVALEKADVPAGEAVLAQFLEQRLRGYTDRRSLEHSSGLSPYLHFGQLGTAQVFAELARREDWNESKLPMRANGSREGAWGMSADANSFLDELVTWRELGFNMTHLRDDYDRYESLPLWARKTLEEHVRDPRPALYSLKQLDEAETGDPLWNACQRQLREEGRIPNYLRMLWGKKIVEWSAHPQDALQILIELNNRYALDGRDPNSYTGIFWCLGRYDRPWFERPVFGKVRYMSSESTRRKLDLKGYLARWG